MEYLASNDTDTHRICGTCGELKPKTEFFKDGKNARGEVRYRRDCKQCYHEARLMAAINDFKRRK